MTLLPADDFGIRGHEGPAYDVGERCSVPRCDQLAVHVHHMWPRSYLRGQPYEWVRLPDGTVIGNRTGLCIGHHDQVTGVIGGHRARIVFESGILWWEIGVDSIPAFPGTAISIGAHAIKTWQRIGALDPQPPGGKKLAETRKPKPNEACPTCGHRKPRKEMPLPTRPKKTWTVLVPADAEDGAEVLDVLVDDLAVVLGMSEYTSRLRRYHVLAAVLTWAQLHRQELLDDLLEAAAS